jgi:hypothetical protein
VSNSIHRLKAKINRELNFNLFYYFILTDSMVNVLSWIDFFNFAIFKSILNSFIFCFELFLQNAINFLSYLYFLIGKDHQQIY